MSPLIVADYHHKEHKEWISELDFYQDEIKIFQKELAAVLIQHSDLYSIIEHVEEYRDILFKKLKQIDDFRKQISLHEWHLSKSLAAYSDDVWDHQELRMQISEFVTEFEGLKKNFRGFVAHNLKSK